MPSTSVTARRRPGGLEGFLGQVVPDAGRYPTSRVHGEGVGDLAGAEHRAGRSSPMRGSSLTQSSHAIGDSGTSMPRSTLCRAYKTSNDFLEMISRVRSGAIAEFPRQLRPWLMDS
jgi:hypothetical protein